MKQEEDFIVLRQNFIQSMIAKKNKTLIFADVIMTLYNSMAKVGYIFKANFYDGFEADKEWMQQYGCVQVIEEPVEHETLRPQWKQLMASLERGDEVVVSKFSNAVQGVRELASFIEFCRIKVVRIISIHDRIDSSGKLFPETTAGEVLEMFGALPEEAAALRKASAHVMRLQLNIKPPTRKTAAIPKSDRKNREKIIVDMYNNGYDINDIFAASGFASRSSIFRILNKHSVTLNRGKFSGPLGKRKKKGEDDAPTEE